MGAEWSGNGGVSFNTGNECYGTGSLAKRDKAGRTPVDASSK